MANKGQQIETKETTTSRAFSLFDFCKKRAGKVQIYGEETLDEEGQVIPFIEQAAMITHYLQLRNTNISIPYAQRAKGILSLWHDFIKGERPRNHIDGGCVREPETILVSRLVRGPISSS